MPSKLEVSALQQSNLVNAQVAWAEFETPPATTTPKAGTDSGSGAEARTLVASLPRTDSGARTETATLVFRTTRTESGSGSDASFLKQQKAGSDTGAGVDASSGRATYARAESGTGADASAERATYTRAESGAGVDSSSVFQASASKSGADAGSGVDTSSVRASLARSEVGAGNDTSSFRASLSRVDACTGADSVKPAKRTIDTGVSADTSLTRALQIASEAGSVLDVASVLLLLSVSDVGAGDDTTILFKGQLPVARSTATITSGHAGSSIASTRGRVTVGLNRGGEDSTIEGNRETAEVTRWP